MSPRRKEGSGIGLLLVASLGLVGAGILALVLSATGRFLPYELNAIGLTPADLCDVAECRVKGFMVHDRAAFGGALVGIGMQYCYLVLGPLRRGDAWAWWLLAVSSSLGIMTFLAFLGSGYIDPWHGTGTLILAVVFAVGLRRARRLRVPSSRSRSGRLPDLFTRAGLGWAVLFAGAGGVAIAGLEIFRIGVTRVFVSQDLTFMGLSSHHLHALDPGLVPLIAHDRISFGAAVLVTGLTTAGHLWYGPVSWPMWATILAAGTVALTAAIGTHLAVGYLDLWHLAPPLLGALALLAGLALTCPGGRVTPAGREWSTDLPTA